MSILGLPELEQVPAVSPSKKIKGPLSYDNCRDCRSKCEHAGKDRPFCYRGESCKKTVKIDLVNVVRCKDCKHWADGVPGCTDHVKCCKIGYYMVGENGYCVYGERR